MVKIKMTDQELQKEMERIQEFLRSYVREGERVVIAVSGGLDSDFVARIAVNTFGKKRVKLFTVLQSDMEDKYIRNARNLAQDVGVVLVELDMQKLPYEFMKAMEADTEEEFHADGLIDPARAKCSLRTMIISTYQDRGYVVLGTSNKTEIKTGFYMPFGDAQAHIKPIAHLYKSQVCQLAKMAGTREEVIHQPASAGFWKGQEDLEDLAYWIYNEKPIGKEQHFTEEDDEKVGEIYKMLNRENVDTTIACLEEGISIEDISKETGLSENIINSMKKMIDYAAATKNRPLLVSMEQR